MQTQPIRYSRFTAAILIAILLAGTPGVHAGADRMESHRSQAAPASPPALPVPPAGYARSLSGSFTLDGVRESLFGTRERITSVHIDGRLTRQAIARPDAQFARGILTTSSHSYDEHGRLVEVLVTDTLQSSPMGFSWIDDQRRLYVYDDSNRVAQLTHSSRSHGELNGWQDYARVSYHYNGLSYPALVVHEGKDRGNWQQQWRDRYFCDPSGNLDSILYESPVGGIWQPWKKESYQRLTEDTVLVLTRFLPEGFVSGRTTYVFDEYKRLKSELQERRDGYDYPFTRTLVTYEYDEDGIVLASESFRAEGDIWYRVARFQAHRNPAPSILLVSPAPDGWYFSGDTVRVRFLGTGEYPVGLEYSTDAGASWVQISSGLPDSGNGTFAWVPGGGLGNTVLRAVAGSTTDELQGNILILPGKEVLTHTTSKLKCDVLSTGYIGSSHVQSNSIWPDESPRIRGSGFRYAEKPNALFSGGVIVGQAGGEMSGMIGSFNRATFEPTLPFSELTRDSMFDQLSRCTIQQPSPLQELEVVQTTGSRQQDDFIVVSYRVKNLSNEALTAFHIGVFADWDIGPYGSNKGGVDAGRGMAYQYDPTRADSNYYGLVALDGLSGAAVTDFSPEMALIESINPVLESLQGDVRTFIGSGPYDILPGMDTSAAFAFVAGSSLADLQAHADSARALWGSPVVSVAEQRVQPLAYMLEQNYPNPFNPSTTIRYSLPVRSHVTLAVYNMLGQVVEVLDEGERQAGYREVTFDASHLSSGVYLYRITAEDYVKTRKLVLIK